MNKNHIDILLTGSSEMVTKYLNKCKEAKSDLDAEFYTDLMAHYIHIYKRAVMLSGLPEPTYPPHKDT